MGRSGCAVAKYVTLKSTPKIVAHTFKEGVRDSLKEYSAIGRSILL